MHRIDLSDADLRGKWVQRGQPALVDSTSSRRAEKVTYSSAVCLETGIVPAMALDGYSSTEASVAASRNTCATNPENPWLSSGIIARRMLVQPSGRTSQRLICATGRVRLPAYRPDYNADEAIWDWAREEVTANTCLGTKAAVRERVDAFFASLQTRKGEVKRRCRSVLQAEATALAAM